MKKLFLACSVFLSFSLLAEMELELHDSVVGKFSSFSVDNFGRISLVKNDVILNLSSNLDTLFSTSLKSFRPSSIESSKSFRTLLFDQERSVIHFLDNTMTDIHGEIDLVNLDMQQPWLVCESFGGNTIWIFDAGSMRLIRLNENLDKLLITENLATVFTNSKLPVRMMEAHDRLFMLVPDLGIAQFDVFGTYLKTYKCKASTFDVFNERLFTLDGDSITAALISPETYPAYTFQAPAEVIQFKFTQDKVYFLTPRGLFRGRYVERNK